MTDGWLARTLDLERAAQRAAERRIHQAQDTLEDEDAEAPDLAGAYCGCLTCDVREALDAAWPFLYRIAIDSETPLPEIPSE